MASLTQTTAVALARLIAQDTHATDPGLSTAKVESLLEEARQWYASTFQDDTFALAYTDSETGITGSLTIDTMRGGAPAECTKATYRSLDTLMLVSGTGLTKASILDRVDWSLLTQRIQKAGAPSGTSIATSWACRRLTDTTWNVIVFPNNDTARKVRIYGHYEVPAMGAGAAVLFGNHGSRVIARLAAIEVARLNGQPDDFIASIASQLPERVLTRRKDLQRLLGVQASGQ